MDDHRTVEAGGIRLAYRVSGPPDAPPLVLLHALGEDAADWDGVTPAFARHWRVYALDLRGHGRSDRPGDYSLELMRTDVLGFLDALALERVDLVGHSMGGVVAYLFAEAHPERVHRLVLEDVPAPRREAGPRAHAHPGWTEEEVRAAASRHISPPDNAPHCAGAAVDLTLATTDGREVDMGCDLNATPEESAAVYGPLIEAGPRPGRNGDHHGV